jgi:hypothetical protein
MGSSNIRETYGKARFTPYAVATLTPSNECYLSLYFFLICLEKSFIKFLNYKNIKLRHEIFSIKVGRK